jgi:hypothetical protein
MQKLLIRLLHKVCAISDNLGIPVDDMSALQRAKMQVKT